MDNSVILPIVKDSLGIRSNIRDTYLTAIIDGVIKEIEDEKGLVLDGANPYHIIFVVDYVTWRYQNKDSEKGMPRYLQYRLHNLIIHVGSSNLNVSNIITVNSLPISPDINTVYIFSTDGSKQMYINDVWVAVEMINGSWVVL